MNDDVKAAMMRLRGDWTDGFLGYETQEENDRDLETVLAHIDGEAARTAAAVAAAREMEAATFEPLARERDALRAQVSELEEYKQGGDDVEVAAQRLRFWAENPYACPVHFGARTACGQCYDSERALRRSTEAQVEAARVMLEARSKSWVASILAAMDGAKP